MIRGYVEQPSPRAGGSLTLRVATDAPRFRVEILRCGTELVPHTRTPWLPGVDAPPHLPFQDWGEPGTGLRGEALAPWAAYRLAVPAGWTSGVYLAAFVEGDEAGRDRTGPDRAIPDGREAKALFVVRPPAGATAHILYKIPLLTYHAYNLVDGREYDPTTGRGHWCLYNMPCPEEVARPIPAGVSLHRPGGGTGAYTYDAWNVDPFDPTPRQTFVHWDARMTGWLERAGYRLDYCTDVDLHREGDALLAAYRLMVSAGHDEYWSADMRSAAERFVAAGGNVAFFGANTCWWHVAFADEVTFARTGFWHETGRPENSFVGVSFRNGGERDRDDHPIPVGYRVQDAGSWVYAGTGLRDGDVFGAGRDTYLVGYECDGADFDRTDLDAGRRVRPTGADGTPHDFTSLGVGDTRPSGWGEGNAAATMGFHTNGETVFTAATTDWPRVLTDGRSPAVEQITRKVLDRLGGR